MEATLDYMLKGEKIQMLKEATTNEERNSRSFIPGNKKAIENKYVLLLRGGAFFLIMN